MLPVLFFPGVKPVITFYKPQSIKIMSPKHNPISVCFWHYSETKRGPSAGHKAEVRELSQIPRAGAGRCQHSHTTLVSFWSHLVWLSSPSWSPNQPCGCHTCGNFVLHYFPLLPSLWVFGKSCCIALTDFYHLCPASVVKCFMTPPHQDPRPHWSGVRCSSQTVTVVSEISVSQRKMNSWTF